MQASGLGHLSLGQAGDVSYLRGGTGEVNVDDVDFGAVASYLGDGWQNMMIDVVAGNSDPCRPPGCPQLDRIAALVAAEDGPDWVPLKRTAIAILVAHTPRAAAKTSTTRWHSASAVQCGMTEAESTRTRPQYLAEAVRIETTSAAWRPPTPAGNMWFDSVVAQRISVGSTVRGGGRRR